MQETTTTKSAEVFRRELGNLFFFSFFLFLFPSKHGSFASLRAGYLTTIVANKKEVPACCVSETLKNNRPKFGGIGTVPPKVHIFWVPNFRNHWLHIPSVVTVLWFFLVYLGLFTSISYAMMGNDHKQHP